MSHPTVRRRAASAAARWWARTAIAALLVGLAIVAAPVPAEAAAYRYWTYWWGNPGASSWAFGASGPGAHVPADGAVEGWRFGVSTRTGGKAPVDGRSPTSVFDELCGTGSAPAGSKRVAVLVDSGVSADAPPGQSPPSPRLWGRCVTAPVGATGASILSRAGAGLRFNSAGLLCGINGYPTGECAPVVTTPAPRPTSSPSTSTPRATRTPAPTPPQSATRTGTPAQTASPPPTKATSTPTAPASPAAATATPSAPPSSTTGPATSDPTASPIATADPVPATAGGDSAPWGLVLGLVIAAGLGGTAAMRMRRSR